MQPNDQNRTIHWLQDSSSQHSEEHTVRSTCPYCGVGCGIVSTIRNGIPETIEGDKLHPANYGRLCSKGAALLETLGHENRLDVPRINGQQTDWDQTIAHISALLCQTIEQHGPESVAFYVSGQLLTEDYYVVNKFVKGYLGTANIDTNSRLCMASSVAAHKRAFGSDTVPGNYEDLELADLVILTGSNLAWCHPVLFQRLQHAREQRPEMQIVVIDPRTTTTAEIADTHLALEPGTDRILFGGLLNYLSKNEQLSTRFINEHTSGITETLSVVANMSLELVADETGCDINTIESFYQSFSTHKKVVTVYSQGINQSIVGTDTVNSILNCHLATGKIGKPGCGPFSITGQPNAMGGREVGGLANMLACHMDIENAEHRDRVQRFWASPAMAKTPGPKAVDLFKAINQDKIKVLWVMATNPADSLPEADAIRQALTRIPTLIVSDVIAETDTAMHAQVLLPALAWGEKDGTVTNSERRISRQRSLHKGPPGARPDWWIVTQVAQAMGFTGFEFNNPASVFREYAALSAFENDDQRDFDIGAAATLSDTSYESLAPFQWPWKAGSQPQDNRFFGDGRFYTADQKSRFIPIVSSNEAKTSDQFPFRLNTGRIRDQWHTMTRTGYSASLSSHCAEPFVEIHPSDADELGMADADIVQVRSQHGSVLVRIQRSVKAKRGNIFVPIHWSGQFASNARVDKLVSSATDPLSGQPAFKSEGVNLRRWQAACYGFAVSRLPLSQLRSTFKNLPYWALAKCEGGWRTEFATDMAPRARPAAEFEKWKEALQNTSVDAADLLIYTDNTAEQYRLALYDKQQLIAAIFLSREPVRLARGWATEALTGKFDSAGSRHRVLSSGSPSDRPDPGTIVCSCHQIGINQITAAIAQGYTTVNAIGQCLGAGTNCGACRTELQLLTQSDKNAWAISA